MNQCKKSNVLRSGYISYSFSAVLRKSFDQFVFIKLQCSNAFLHIKGIQKPSSWPQGDYNLSKKTIRNKDSVKN